MYQIYEVPGVKIGCTSKGSIRPLQQGYDNWIILEEHEDIMVASEREIELQKEKGYKVDSQPYWDTINRPTLAGRQRGGLKTGKNNAALFLTKEACAKGGSIASNKFTHPNKQKVTCPHCNMEGQKITMMRWHFNNCKHKK
jgi:hypothetical protein